MILASWNCFITPYEIAFDHELSNNPSIFLVNSIIDFIFFIDIILNFRTSFYISSTGDEIFDGRLIAKNYLMGNFWFDILSCFPSDVILSNTNTSLEFSTVLALFGLLKLYRISRLNRIINFARARNDVKLVLRICQLLFFLLMYVHLVACSWWIIVTYDEL